MIKRFIILLFSIFFLGGFIWFEINNATESLARSRLPFSSAQGGSVRGIPILMYHKINPDPRTGGLGLRVPPHRFKRQMRYLAENGYFSISLVDLVAHLKKGKPLPPHPVVITFDDGYQDNYQYAFPILKTYGFTATIFVVANTVGGTNRFDAEAKLQPENKMANWQELMEMASYGIEIGSHTLDHPRLTRLSTTEAKRQVQNSKSLLEKYLGKPVKVFSYPYGDFNPEIARIVEKSGYVAAVTTVQGPVLPGDNLYTLRRIRITGRDNMKNFIEKLQEYTYSPEPGPEHPTRQNDNQQ